MKILILLSLLCFAALVWAALSVFRHVRRQASAQAATPGLVLVPRTKTATTRQQGSSLAA